jgi:hypothetical protein
MQVRSYVHYIARKVTYITYRVYFLMLFINIPAITFLTITVKEIC